MREMALAHCRRQFAMCVVAGVTIPNHSSGSRGVRLFTLIRNEQNLGLRAERMKIGDMLSSQLNHRGLPRRMGVFPQAHWVCLYPSLAIPQENSCGTTQFYAG
jgi:hypothetical protein